MTRLFSRLVVLLAVAVCGCASLPPPSGRTATTALADIGDTLLGRAVAPLVAANPDRTGVHPLFDPCDAFGASPLVTHLVERRVAFEWTGARVYHDDPAKTLDADERMDDLLFPKLLEAMGRPQARLDLVSPYFVPGDAGTALLAAAAARGVRVRILTNSLASTDEPAVHAGCAKRRADLLRAGVRIYELKPTAAVEARAKQDGFGSNGSAGLHAKTFAVDGRRIFVGSFNMDPRSMHLNTEMGVVLDSPVLARALGDAFDTAIPEVAYEVRLDSDGRTVYWIERTAHGEARHDTEPATTAVQRMNVQVLSILPIEWLL